MFLAHNPDEIAKPLGAYTHGVEVPPGFRYLAVSGQVGILPDGSVAEGIEAQLECAWTNIVAILRSAGMSVAHIVKVTTYVTKPEHFLVHPKVRARFLGSHRPAATGLCVSALASPDFLCELEVVAAAPPTSAV